jgi:putative endonuclease
MAYFVYIIQSLTNDSYHIGSTQNIEKRLQRHNQGRSQYTKPKSPWQLVHLEEFSNKSDAIKRENQIKRLKSRQSIESLIGIKKHLRGDS